MILSVNMTGESSLCRILSVNMTGESNRCRILSVNMTGGVTGVGFYR